MNEQTLIHTVSVALMTEKLQSVGYRVTPSEQNGIVQLLSASQGVGFSVRFGNAATETNTWLDFTFGCVLRIEGELPLALVAQWNLSKRFSRLTVQEQFLVLEMDCIVAGGVSDGYLHANIEIWDRLMQDFLLFLRNFQPASVAVSRVEQDGAAQQSVAVAPLAEIKTAVFEGVEDDA